jgi:predicted RNA-binding Zn-ribbon protein involved in translation (DUF1610 family)
MQEKEFVDQLVSYATCTHCDLTISAPVWRVSRFDDENWLGLNIVACPKCGNVIIGAAGTCEDSVAQAKAIRQRILSDAGKDIFG